MDIVVCVAAAVEERPVVGVRGSARWSANAEAAQACILLNSCRNRLRRRQCIFPEIVVLYDFLASRFSKPQNYPVLAFPYREHLVLLAATRGLMSRTVVLFNYCHRIEVSLSGTVTWRLVMA